MGEEGELGDGRGIDEGHEMGNQPFDRYGSKLLTTMDNFTIPPQVTCLAKVFLLLLLEIYYCYFIVCAGGGVTCHV